jgi:hypothetical protein
MKEIVLLERNLFRNTKLWVKEKLIFVVRKF